MKCVSLLLATLGLAAAEDFTVHVGLLAGSSDGTDFTGVTSVDAKGFPDVTNFQFYPRELTITEGDTVSYRFYGVHGHVIGWNRDSIPVTPDRWFDGTNTIVGSGLQDTATIPPAGGAADQDNVLSGLQVGAEWFAWKPNLSKTWDVTYPTAGGYSMYCTLHPNMGMDVIVLAADDAVNTPDTPESATSRAADEANAEREAAEATDLPEPMEPMMNGDGTATHHVIAGFSVGDTAYNRYIPDVTVVHVGDSVKFTTHDALIPKSVVFLSEGIDRMEAFRISGTAAAGGYTASLPMDYEASPILEGAPTDEDRIFYISGNFFADIDVFAGLPKEATFTFTEPGTYAFADAVKNYDAMSGTIVVLPRDDAVSCDDCDHMSGGVDTQININFEGMFRGFGGDDTDDVMLPEDMVVN